MKKVVLVLVFIARFFFNFLKATLLYRWHSIAVTEGERKMQPYQRYALKKFRLFCLPNAEGKHILEIGSDLDSFMIKELASRGAKRVVGINKSEDFWKDKERPFIELGANVTFMEGDTRSLSFDDSEFDAIVSVAVFEHINDLGKGLEEMYRVLKPGAAVFSFFGPIWSSALGHHLYAVVGEEEARFWKPDKNPLADYSHLFMDVEEMKRSLKGSVSEALSAEVISWIYEKDDINRLFYRDYKRILFDSSFAVERFVPHVQWIDPDMESLLRAKYGEDNLYSCHALEVVLRKPL